MIEDREGGHGRLTIPSGAIVNRRPRLSIVAPDASPEEAAAVVAALERFMRVTAPRRVPPPPPGSAWQRAALAEGVARQPYAPYPWH